MSKCMCHFNGYEIKDAYARNLATQTNDRVTNLNNNNISQHADLREKDTELENRIISAESAAEALESRVSGAEGEIGSIHEFNNSQLNNMSELEAKVVKNESDIKELQESGGGSGGSGGYKLICDYTTNALINQTANITTFADGTALNCNELLVYVDCFYITPQHQEPDYALEAPAWIFLNNEEMGENYPFTFGIYNLEGINGGLFDSSSGNYQPFTRDVWYNDPSNFSEPQCCEVKYTNGRFVYKNLIGNSFVGSVLTSLTDEAITKISVGSEGYIFAIKIYGR